MSVCQLGYVSMCKEYTLSPISETNINENAAVKPDFASAGKTDVGPFLKRISKNAKVHEHSTMAIGKR